MAILDGERDDPRDEPWLGDEDEAFGNDNGPVDEAGHAQETDLDHGAYGEPAQLELGDEDVRLPWLEGDDEYEEEGGYATGQVVVLVLLGLLAIGLIVGGIWWALRDRPDRQLVADGGVISAPAGPYKARPDNPGGEVVAGTGDTSFAVAEGQSRPVQVGDKPVASPAPSASPVPKPGFSDAKPTASASPAADAASGVGVQVGAYSSREAAEKGWTTMQQQFTPLAGMSHRIVEGQADIGHVFRLQAVPGDAAAARSLCANMRSAGLSCQVKD